MNIKILKFIAILLVLTGSLASCKNSDSSDTNINVTGTIVGSYSNGFCSLLIQVDKKYPIGKTLNYSGVESCLKMPNFGIFQNMIEVQPDLPLLDFPETESLISKRLSFSYRAYNSEKDNTLFLYGIGNELCSSPDVPTYVITNCQILK